MTISGQFSCPPAGSYVAVSGQNAVAADISGTLLVVLLVVAFSPILTSALPARRTPARDETEELV